MNLYIQRCPANKPRSTHAKRSRVSAAALNARLDKSQTRVYSVRVRLELEMINWRLIFACEVTRARGLFYFGREIGIYVHFVVVCVLEIKLGNAFINNGRMHRSRAGARASSSNFHALSHEVCKRCIKLYRITKAAWPGDGHRCDEDMLLRFGLKP